MREIAAEWTGSPLDSLTPEPGWGLTDWGIQNAEEYERLHRFAVTQHDLFSTMKPIVGAPQAIRRLGTEGIRIRIITHRLFIRYFHEAAVSQTVRWLDKHSIPYWDLCFMRHKDAVGADLYVEDSPENIKQLRSQGHSVVIYGNTTNMGIEGSNEDRADNWDQAERLIRTKYYAWLDRHALSLPGGPGLEPDWAKEDSKPVV
jgi:5'(3')-deoxyribonucleotidase